jgi:hypothetical protein
MKMRRLADLKFNMPMSKYAGMPIARSGKTFAYLLIFKFANFLIFSFLLSSCEMDDFVFRPVKDVSFARNLYVSVHWDHPAPGDSLPDGGMRILLFPESGGTSLEYPLGIYGGWLWLPPGSSCLPFCYNYENMEYLELLHRDNAGLFEVHNVSAYDNIYNTKVGIGHDEPTVRESFPYAFYISRDNAAFSVPSSGSDTLHCFPRNVLHEFTFLVYGVDGAKNVASSRGAISGMSASYFPASDALSENASTVLFHRAVAIEEGKYPWHMPDSVQFVPCPDRGSIPVHPCWFPDWLRPDLENNKWGDWIIGAFSVFGPVTASGLQNQLTLECFSQANYGYAASWGYWEGSWEETVHRQIMGALGYFDECPADAAKGSLEAQTAWRKHNGGFDIILFNDGRLVIPPDIGLDVKVPGWDGVTVPL